MRGPRGRALGNAVGSARWLNRGGAGIVGAGACPPALGGHRLLGGRGAGQGKGRRASEAGRAAQGAVTNGQRASGAVCPGQSG